MGFSLCRKRVLTPVTERQSVMTEDVENAKVWIGVVCVVPREGCDLLPVNEGAYVNFLTLANSDAEYRAKISGALATTALN